MTIVYFNHHIVMLYFLNKVEVLGKKTMLQQEFKKRTNTLLSRSAVALHCLASYLQLLLLSSFLSIPILQIRSQTQSRIHPLLSQSRSRVYPLLSQNLYRNLVYQSQTGQTLIPCRRQTLSSRQILSLVYQSQPGQTLIPCRRQTLSSRQTLTLVVGHRPRPRPPGAERGRTSS